MKIWAAAKSRQIAGRKTGRTIFIPVCYRRKFKDRNQRGLFYKQSFSYGRH